MRNSLIFHYALLLLVHCARDLVLSAKILAAIPSPFYSHQATFRPLWRELAKRGHRLTLITTNPMERNENITQIDYGEMYSLFEKHQIDEMIKGDGFGNLYRTAKKFIDMTEDHYRIQLAHPDLVKLIGDGEKFDLLISEVLTPTTVLSHTFNCPFISVTTLDALFILHNFLGNAEHPAIYPFSDLGYVGELGFRERLISTALNAAFRVLIPTVFEPLSNKFVKKYLGDGYPSGAEIMKNASLVMINANPIFFPPRPITPKTINLGGGLHLSQPKQLALDLREYLDGSRSGCVYFSLGSTVNSNYLTPEIVEIFKNVFAKLEPMRVLWKFENETLENMPDNLMIRKWFPQLDILRHPNVKMFITQGGLQSMEEAVDSSVPMLAFPFFGDQFRNAKVMALKKFGIVMDHKNIDERNLLKNIREILDNPIYKTNVAKYSKIFKDRPQSPLQEAVFWIEYVLKHGSTDHLTSPSSKIPFYQYYFLDIISFLLAAIAVLIFAVYSLIKFVASSLRRLVKITRRSKAKIN